MNDMDDTSGAAPGTPLQDSAESSVRPELPHSPTTADLLSNVLTELAAHSRLADLPAKWTFLKKSGLDRQLCVSTPKALAALREKFSDDQLCDARLLIRQGEDLLLNPVIGDNSAKFFLESDNNGRLLEALSGRGSISSPQPSVLRYAEQRCKLSSSSRAEGILVAAGDDDLQVVRRLGYFALPAAGLESLTGAQVRRMFDGVSGSCNCCKYHLTLIGWQPALIRNSLSPEMTVVLRHLNQIIDVFNFDLDCLFDVWRPNAVAIRRIESARTFADKAAVRECFAKSMSQSRYSVPGFCQDHLADECSGAAGLDLLTAQKELKSAIDRSQLVPHTREIRAAAKQLRRVMQAYFIDSFWQAAQTTDDPAVRGLLYIGGELMGDLVNQQGLMRGADALLAGQHPPSNFDILGEVRTAQLLKLANTLVQIQRAITTEKRNQIGYAKIPKIPESR